MIATCSRRIGRRLALVALALLVPACGVGGVGGSSSKVNLPPSSSMAPAEAAEARAVVNRINVERAARGLPPYTMDTRASDAAYDHAVDMRTRGFYAHFNPDGEGPCTRLTRAGVDALACGAENIARGQETAGEVVNVWLASGTHRANVLSPHATHVGVGVSMGGDGPWWVMDLMIPGDGR